MTVPEIQFDPSSARFGASRTQKRVEDDRLLAGKGLYSDDRNLPDQAWMIVVRSPYAHARIASVNADAARAASSAAKLEASNATAMKRSDGTMMFPWEDVPPPANQVPSEWRRLRVLPTLLETGCCSLSGTAPSGIDRQNRIEIGGFQACAADQGAVYVRHEQKLAGIGGLNRAAIKDAQA